VGKGGRKSADTQAGGNRKICAKGGKTPPTGPRSRGNLGLSPGRRGCFPALPRMFVESEEYGVPPRRPLSSNYEGGRSTGQGCNFGFLSASSSRWEAIGPPRFPRLFIRDGKQGEKKAGWGNWRRANLERQKEGPINRTEVENRARGNEARARPGTTPALAGHQVGDNYKKTAGQRRDPPQNLTVMAVRRPGDSPREARGGARARGGGNPLSPFEGGFDVLWPQVPSTEQGGEGLGATLERSHSKSTPRNQ